MPKICAVILDYFGSSKTITCLQSLTDQDIDSAMIVDNSGDQKANMQLQKALSEFRQNNPHLPIHQIINQKNLGFAKGVNNALRWLEKNQPHRYYLLINNDAEATPGMLSELIKYMGENSRAVLAAPVIDTGLKLISYTWYHRFTGLMFSHHVIGTFPYLTGCCLLLDRQIVDDGLFDEDFFMYGEDVALSWRLTMSGYDVTCVKNAIVRHKGVGSSHQGELFYEYHLARGHVLLARKIAKCCWEMPCLYAGRLLTLLARAIMRTIRYRSFIPLMAIFFAFSKHDVLNAKT